MADVERAASVSPKTQTANGTNRDVDMTGDTTTADASSPLGAPALSLKFDYWPVLDRELWLRGCAPIDPFAPPGTLPAYGATLRDSTRCKYLNGYGTWLAFLVAQGLFDPVVHPADRITLPRLGTYFRELKARDNASHTILARFVELRAAMRIIAPERNMDWIDRPNGRPIRSMLRMTWRTLQIPDTEVLFAWGKALIDTYDPSSEDPKGCVNYRDGLIIALLASRGRRKRSMGGLRVGTELYRVGDRYWIDLPPERVKTNRRDRFPVPATLTPAFDRYLHEIRPMMMRGHPDHDALWVTHQGKPLTVDSFAQMIFKRSLAQFGCSFGPHRFRYAIGTTVPMRRPDEPGLAACALDMSFGVHKQSYDRAGQTAGMQAFAAMREAEQKAALEDAARRERLARANRSEAEAEAEPGSEAKASDKPTVRRKRKKK